MKHGLCVTVSITERGVTPSKGGVASLTVTRSKGDLACVSFSPSRRGVASVYFSPSEEGMASERGVASVSFRPSEEKEVCALFHRGRPLCLSLPVKEVWPLWPLSHSR